MLFVFVRHGHYDRQEDKAKRKHAHLNEQGRADARAAGAFLREHHVEPNLVCRTDTQRTKDTAEIVLGELDVECAARPPEEGWPVGASVEAITARIEKWAADASVPVRTLLFVGHDKQQIALLRELGGQKIPKDRRGCVLVYEREGAGDWTVGPHFQGS